MSNKINILLLLGIWNSSILRTIKSSEFDARLFLYNVKEVKDVDFIKGNNDFFRSDMPMCEYGRLVKEKNIDLAVVLDSRFVDEGFVNYFKYNLGIPTVGITRGWAQLENSKRFGKKFMQENGIPTPEYSIVFNLSDLKEKIIYFGLPLLIKNDIPQCGFGSYICKTEEDCYKIANKLLKENKFFIVEKFIEGEEVTLQTIWDGKNLIPLPSVRDYKRLKRNNEGINTGSMGCYLPVNLSEKKQRMLEEYVKNLESVFIKIKPNFTGIFASDLIFTEEEVFNLEFNMRPCTPEFEAFLHHMNNDIVKFFYDIALGNAKEIKFDYKSGITGCVNVFHKDYVKHITEVKKKKVKLSKRIVTDTENIKINSDFKLSEEDEAMVSLHVRALCVLNNDPVDPFPAIYEHLGQVTDKNLFYREDIGK